MEKLMLPEQLKSWKVGEPVADAGNYPAYNVVKTDEYGAETEGVLTYVCFEGDNYNRDNVDLVNEEAAFVKSVIKLRGVSNYLDAVADNDPSENKISLYLLTNSAVSCRDMLTLKSYTDAEIIDFGLQISDILDKLEQNNILHGNLKPENIFLNSSGRYMLGGFTAFEGSVEDPSFMAPEMRSGKAPDYTTDIYSLGLIMYAMSNGGKLPFENDETDRAAAVQKRLSAQMVTAPQNGTEKLKSVIVIACQPDNRNRWKNAGNIKNALAAIKAELPQTAPAAAVTELEPTDFESNVFEEFTFDGDTPQTEPAKQEPEQPEMNMAKGAAIAAVAAAATAATATALQASDNDKNDETPKESSAAGENAADEPKADAADEAPAEDPLNNSIFDDYVPDRTQVFNARSERKEAEKKDYGAYFDEEPEMQEIKPDPPFAGTSAAAQSKQPDDKEEDAYDPYYDGEYDEDEEPQKANKSFILGVIVIILALLAALAALGVYAWQNDLLPFGNNSTPETTAAPATQTTAAVTTAPVTTVPETTAEPTEEPVTEEPTTIPETTVPYDVYPENVIGFYYDYAEEVLRAQGLEVAYGESVPSSEYDYGFVISMSPTDSTLVKSGSTVTLVLSSGKTGDTESSQTESSQTE